MAKKLSKAQQKSRMSARYHFWSILLFGIGILLGALTLLKGQNVWTVMHDFLFGLFGLATYLIPIITIAFAVMLGRERSYSSIQVRLIQSLILILLVSGLTQLIFGSDIIGNGFFDKIVNLFQQGQSLKGGGVTAAILAWPLQAGLGKTGAIIVTVILLFVLVMLVTGKTLFEFFTAAKKPVEKTMDLYTESKIRKEERIKNKKIDIDIDDKKKKIDIPLEDMPGRLVESELPQLPKKKRKEYVAPDDGLDLITDKFGKYEDIPIDENAKPMEDFFAPSPTPSTGGGYATQGTEYNSTGEEVEKISKKEVVQATASVSREIQEKEELYGDKGEIKTYKFPPLSLLEGTVRRGGVSAQKELRENEIRLVKTLESFGVKAKVIDVSRGPTVTRYELQPSAGVKISKITNLADDIALSLAASGIRIEAPIPGKAAVGIEVPNQTVEIVKAKEIFASREFQTFDSKLGVALGRDITGQARIADLAKMPHMLVAGATGSGKSVCINTIITSLLYRASPEDVKLVMIDPKVVELGIYNGIPHLLVPVVTDPKKAAGALGWAVGEMLKRYKKFADNNVRDLKGYNDLVERQGEENEELKKMPQIVIIIDELADLMMASPKEVEDSICRLAQMARAAGMHLIIATQRPSVDVITGIIKANIPSRIAFSVSSQVDSRTILDGAGAEKLLGRGDMLFSPVGAPKPVRVQGCFITDKEIESVVNFIKSNVQGEYDDEVIEEIEKQAPVDDKKSDGGGGFSDNDPMVEKAIELAVELGEISTSMIQRKLSLGYARAARVVDTLEEMGIIGPREGSKPRKVLMTRQQWVEMKLNTMENTPEQQSF